MKTLQEYVNEGILDADLIDKEVDRTDLIESSFKGFHSKAVQNVFSQFLNNVIDLECALTYHPIIKNALDPIIDKLEDKDYISYRFLFRELDGVRSKILKYLERITGAEIPDYSDKMMKIVQAAHEFDDLLDKLCKKYKNASVDDIYVSLNIRNKRVNFVLSVNMFDDAEKVMDKINKHRFSSCKVYSNIIQDGDLITILETL